MVASLKSAINPKHDVKIWWMDGVLTLTTRILLYSLSMKGFTDRIFSAWEG